MNPLLFNLNGWEIPIIILVVLILFGGKKIPEFMKGLGKGINSFKRGLNEIEEEIKADPTDKTTTNNQ
ncbi:MULTISPECIES: Sec-independent protein translocase subunit TatA/TatB [Petrimonas]|jgi:sec-independent protein translocase protein TatA|uniref:Sec-independent protein translocase protein TatA n=1 Tax=Petrimonas mucosa TaxID=1642646 RepID=A0A1G4G9J6_9BACT|nr:MULTISPECIES: twin-arginine translocase TatA/TatE family subunit [Petrimonas]MDD3560046.1 twin-arginine translocase TatA/TatE family subunit [Petrimonas mucosa]SCM59214.1 Sec-independent protein translocase protein TatA {ECO:0000256/HAMAP-Rule:MF_00236} [Petrimonas mucosa]SFU30108.1 sec-independent protein translocase protein TatA [Porphyromonadaceae bacterium KHP3R9]HHT28834.1 twin-arginine translocase TatA/TatE family subunit [Petrimonas mucosa]